MMLSSLVKPASSSQDAAEVLPTDEPFQLTRSTTVLPPSMSLHTRWEDKFVCRRRRPMNHAAGAYPFVP